MPSQPIRVGIIGANIHRGFATAAHIPALQALPDFAISAVCTTRQESADEAATQLGASRAFTDPRQLAEHPDVNVVAVSVRVPGHRDAVLAATSAGKHVYCEWPLGRTLAEARELYDAAQAAGVRHVVGLQARTSPWANYVRDLLAAGEIGRVLSATVAVSAASYPATTAGAYMLDRANGMNTLTITGGHTLDLLRYTLGDFSRLAAFELNQYPEVPAVDGGPAVAKNTLDQLVLSGVAGEDVAVSYQLRGGGSPREPRFSFEIHGADGDLLLTSLSTTPESMQRQHLTLFVRKGSGEFTVVEIPDGYRRVPAETPPGAPYNVAQMYAGLAESIRTGVPAAPGFDVAVGNHQVLDAVVRASETGRVQSAADIAAI